MAAITLSLSRFDRGRCESAASCARETLFGGIKVLLTGLKAA